MSGQMAVLGVVAAMALVLGGAAAMVALQLRKRAVLEAARVFFRDRSCATCGTPIPRPAITARPPALRAMNDEMSEWTALSPAELRDAVVTHVAVCWNCYVAEEFRHRYPERVTDRPPHTSPVH
jgi:hypothetical protein